ncbi:MAG: inositol-phosphate phosphatase / L-galactose 1-phosphate phosphatase / histidinol-phosphatase [Pseudomonadota bacterium]|nr:inositol-phosphate phosphatase / L-galactose 1-phosphate phosphatase / histidinol-phosphatase [Pseudomonadota bacterium]
MQEAFGDEFFVAGIQLADLASEITRKYFREKLDVKHKSDCHPVTIVDQKVEQSLREWLTVNYPDHGIIGEEYAAQNILAKYTWTIDPIDGTVAFATGKPVFATLIALLEDGVPMLGIIDQPIINERFIGVRGSGAWVNGKKMTTSNQSVLSKARLNATTPYMFKTDEDRDAFQRLHRQVNITGWGGDAYAYGLLADGHIDIILEADLGFYDVAALRPIIEESGGIITDWDGNNISHENFDGKCLACANSQLHEAVLKTIKE